VGRGQQKLFSWAILKNPALNGCYVIKAKLITQHDCFHRGLKKKRKRVQGEVGGIGREDSTLRFAIPPNWTNSTNSTNSTKNMTRSLKMPSHGF